MNVWKSMKRDDSIMNAYNEENVFSENNPKFIGLVNLLDAMCEEGLLQRNPDDRNSVLIYRSGVDADTYEASEGWFSQNVFDVAQEIMDDCRNGDKSFFEALAEQGYDVAFTEAGKFSKLIKTNEDTVPIPKKTASAAIERD